jgi:hypothetical protein
MFRRLFLPPSTRTECLRNRCNSLKMNERVGAGTRTTAEHSVISNGPLTRQRLAVIENAHRSDKCQTGSYLSLPRKTPITSDTACSDICQVTERIVRCSQTVLFRIIRQMRQFLVMIHLDCRIFCTNRSRYVEPNID